MKHLILVVCSILWLLLAACVTGAESGIRARYAVLTARQHQPPPFTLVDIVRGPMELIGGRSWHWWQIEVGTNTNSHAQPMFQLRALTSHDPLAAEASMVEFSRYLLRIPALNETTEYRDCHTQRALLPAWKDFERWFIPRPTAATRRQRDMPETGELLGHVLSLQWVGESEVWQPWDDAKVLSLDRELLVGTGRNFKDQEGHRLPQQPQRQNYTYIPFTKEDYQIMMEAGINLFTVAPDQEAWVRAEPVFYLRGVEGRPPLTYPTDLYRANYLGPVMFMDEPSILMVGDKLIHNTLRYFSDAAALIEKRTRVTYLSDGNYGAFRLERSLIQKGVNFGDMRLMQSDIPSWETLYDTTFYQMKGGGAGLIHEGRYQLAAFDKAVARFTGHPRQHTARELLLYHYAFLRGGTRPFGKDWGTAIYGQCDTNIAPLAVTLAYDLGARYVWFWTSDHDHHVPWPEQLALARTLKRHAQAHPRPSLHSGSAKVDVAIAIPNGYFLSLDNLWWVRVMDKEGKNEASLKFRHLMHNALRVVYDCLDQGKSFDFTVDDGRPIKDYRRVILVKDMSSQ